MTLFITGLSWLIGGSLQEVLTSIIFLFVKHPFDVGDRVDIDQLSYTVKEIRLLSTIFLDARNVSVQAPNMVLNTLVRAIRTHEAPTPHCRLIDDPKHTAQSTGMS